MSTHSVIPIRGSTASCALPPPRTARPAADPPRHRLGETMHAAGVFLDAAFRVVVLGTDGMPHSGPAAGDIPGQGRPGH